jgi:hypothetical protein
MNPVPNGRVDTLSSNGKAESMHHNNLTKYDFFMENKKDPSHFQANAVRHIHSDSQIASLYFSQTNIDILQDGIRYCVYTKTNNKHIIDRQSEIELQVIMRSMYLQYCKHLEDNIIQQVKELNKRVLDYVLPIILSEINQFVNYNHDINFLPVPLQRGQHMSTRGSKVLSMKDF